MTIPAMTPISAETAHPFPSFLRRRPLANPHVASCGNHDHFAIIYDNPDEQLDFIVPYLRLGLERGEKAVYIHDDNSAETVIAAMERHGIDVCAATSIGALSILTKNHAYLKNGEFDPDWMVDFLGQAVDDAKKEGFPALRASGEMTWALGPTGEAHGHLVEYECKLNTLFPNFDISGICQYNRHRFRAHTLMHVIHTHPQIVFRGELVENPYFIPAEILNGESADKSEAVLRLLESMSENSRLRRQLATETEALRSSERLAVAARMASIVAHEINNPLEAMTNVCYLLQHQDVPPATREYLDMLGQELERVCQLSKRTLDVFRAAESAGEADLSVLN